MFKKGDKVRFISDAVGSFYPPKGTVGTISAYLSEGLPYVQWPAGSTHGSDEWLCSEDKLELAAGE